MFAIYTLYTSLVICVHDNIQCHDRRQKHQKIIIFILAPLYIYNMSTFPLTGIA